MRLPVLNGRLLKATSRVTTATRSVWGRLRCNSPIRCALTAAMCKMPPWAGKCGLKCAASAMPGGPTASSWDAPTIIYVAMPGPPHQAQQEPAVIRVATPTQTRVAATAKTRAAVIPVVAVVAVVPVAATTRAVGALVAAGSLEAPAVRAAALAAARAVHLVAPVQAALARAVEAREAQAPVVQVPVQAGVARDPAAVDVNLPGSHGNDESAGRTPRNIPAARSVR